MWVQILMEELRCGYISIRGVARTVQLKWPNVTANINLHCVRVKVFSKFPDHLVDQVTSEYVLEVLLFFLEFRL